MGDSSFLQTNFLGGEWSPFAQGRADEEVYRTGMNVCLNSLPVEEGAWVRRAGTMFAATTRKGVQGLLRSFDFQADHPYNMEFTAGHMRLFSGLDLVLELQHVIVSVSSASPGVWQTAFPHGYSTNDQVEFAVTYDAGYSPAGAVFLYNRQFEITVIDATHFTAHDPITGQTVNGPNVDLSHATVTVARVLDFATVYTLPMIQANAIRLVQNDTVAMILNGAVRPYVLTASTFLSPTGFQTFTFATGWPTSPPAPGSLASLFQDGPYLDPPQDGSTLTPDGLGPTLNVTASSIASINNGTGFQATDVNRMIRLFSEPAAWAIGTAYNAGDNIKYNGGYYQAVKANTGVQPDTDDGTFWIISTTAAIWTWGLINSVASPTVANITLAASDPNSVLAGGDLLYSRAIATWQLGVYSDTTGWPTGGTYHEGRFWLFGAIGNRIDASMSNQAFCFSPSALDDTVADDNGISAVFDSTDVNAIFWAVPSHAGIVLGTLAGEWLIQASSLNDPLTPNSIQAHRVTRYGCANVEARETGLSTVFVERYQRKLYEYISDVYSGKYSGSNIAVRAKHLTSSNVEEIVYQREPTPVIWARNADGSLIGCSYKRESPFSTQPASFFGWHRHILGSLRSVHSIQSGPSPDGKSDSVGLVTLDSVTGIYFVEFFAPFFDEVGTLLSAAFLDGAVTPTAAEIVGSNVIFYGLKYIAGKTITLWLGGVDGGDYAVAGNGTVTVPLGAGGGILTQAYLLGLSGSTYGVLNLNIEVSPPGQGFSSPNGASLSYTASSSPPLHFLDGQFDWDGGFLYSQQAQHSGDPGSNGHSLFIFNIATQAQVAGPLDPGELASASGTGCMGYDGNIYYGTIDGTHLVCRYNTTTRTNDITYNDTHGLDAVGYIGPLHSGAVEYAVITSITSGTVGSRVNVINMSAGPAWTGTTFTVDEAPGSLAPGNAFPCRGPEGAAFIVSIIPATIGLYRVQLEAGVPAMPKIGVLHPTDIDAGWSTFGISQPLYDETDGNVLLYAVNGSNASDIRLIKINTRSGALMWKLTIASTVDWHKSRVRYGRLTLLDGPSPYSLKVINTLTGAVVSTSTETVIATNQFSADDVSGQIVVQINDIAPANWATFGPANTQGAGAITPALVYTSPALLGFTFTSQGQILRAIVPQESGARNGPALGKTRRTHQTAILMALTQGISVGTDFNFMHLATLTSRGGDGTVGLTQQQLFTGIYWDTVDDEYTFNGMVCWQVTRPYPANVLSVSQFLHTQDR